MSTLEYAAPTIEHLYDDHHAWLLRRMGNAADPVHRRIRRHCQRSIIFRDAGLLERLRRMTGWDLPSELSPSLAIEFDRCPACWTTEWAVSPGWACRKTCCHGQEAHTHGGRGA